MEDVRSPAAERGDRGDRRRIAFLPSGFRPPRPARLGRAVRGGRRGPFFRPDGEIRRSISSKPGSDDDRRQDTLSPPDPKGPRRRSIGRSGGGRAPRRHSRSPLRIGLDQVSRRQGRAARNHRKEPALRRRPAERQLPTDLSVIGGVCWPIRERIRTALGLISFIACVSQSAKPQADGSSRETIFRSSGMSPRSIS